MPDLGSVHYGDLIGQNLSYYVSQMLGMGKSESEVLALLIKHKSDVDTPTMVAAFGHGIQAASFAAGFPKLGQERFVGGAAVPVNPDLPQQYRYVLQVEAIDPAGGESSYRMMVIDSDQRLRKGELQEQMLSRWNQVLAQLGYPSISFAQADYARIALLQSVERRE